MDYWTILLRVALAVILGGIIGMERQSKHRPAGFRTHILVCLGSAAIMLMSEMIFIRYYENYGVASDPTRIAAQVVSGIGFLGAGTIIHFGANVTGLTTAASLWAVAAIGLAVGAGFYELAVTVSAVMYATLIVFDKVSIRMDKRKKNKAAGTSALLVSMLNKPQTLGKISLAIAKNNGKILDIVFPNQIIDVNAFEKTEDVISAKIVLLVDNAALAELIQEIRSLNGVLTVEKTDE